MSVASDSATSTRRRKTKNPVSKRSQIEEPTISISKASQAVGAIVTDIDLSKDFSDAEIATLRDAFNTQFAQWLAPIFKFLELIYPFLIEPVLDMCQ